MKRMKWIWSALVAIGMFCLISFAVFASEKVAPSVLLLCAGERQLDFNYLKALHARGFQINYCSEDIWSKEAVAGELIERLRCYHAVVMIQGGHSRTSFDDSANMAKLFKTLATYAEEGGGLFMMPNPISWDQD